MDSSSPHPSPAHRPLQTHLRLAHRISALESHHRFGVALIVALLAFACASHVRLGVRVIIGWDAYAACLLALAWSRIFTAKPRVVVQLAKLTHTSRKLIFLFIIAAACASLMAVAFLLGTAKDLGKSRLAEHVSLAMGTVMLSWLLVHTVFALHYAFLYFRPGHPGEAERKAGGLIFPEPTEPDYSDFAYFAFIIGMTSQVSDVQIASREIRRWALLHGMVSFGFNTAVLALSLNIVSGLL